MAEKRTFIELDGCVIIRTFHGFVQQSIRMEENWEKKLWNEEDGFVRVIFNSSGDTDKNCFNSKNAYEKSGKIIVWLVSSFKTSLN